MGKEKIEVKHENGYSGVLYGKSSMIIYHNGKQFIHTFSRTVNTKNELYELLSQMPHMNNLLSQNFTKIYDDNSNENDDL